MALDAKKAYSKTYQEGLIFKLATKYNVRGNLLSFVRSFLSESKKYSTVVAKEENTWLGRAKCV